MTQAAPTLTTLRVDHVGSFLRPDTLRDVIARYDQQQATDEELHAAQDAAIREVVAQQEAIQFPVVNDGEFRRINFQDSFAGSVSGFEGDGRAIVDRQPTVARLQVLRNQPLEEYRFIRSIARGPVKTTLVSPDRISQRFDWEASRSVYADREEFIQDIVAIEQRMVRELVEAGCTYVQIDAPSYTAYVDGPSLQAMRARGEDPVANMERSMAADNALLARAPGVTFGIHLCRGNTAAGLPQPRSGAYDAIAERLFGTLQHDRFLLEYDTAAAGGFEPLRFVPKGKVAVLGLVSTRGGGVETADELKRRIEEASHYLPLEQLALSPQCGFSSRVATGPNRLSIDEQWRKLERIVEVAADVWG